MGAIQNFSLQDFTQAVQNKLGNSNSNNIGMNKSAAQLNSIYTEAAAKDDGEDKNLLETDYNNFENLVQKGVELVKNTLMSMGIPLDGTFNLFTSGNIEGKNDGAQNWDTLQQYQNGNLVNIKEGIDNNGDNTLTADEVEFTNHPDAQTGVPSNGNYTIFTSGDIPEKQNGAQGWDTVKRFENGKLVEIIEGIDNNGDGALTGDEIEETRKMDT